MANDIVKKAGDYVLELFKKKLDDRFVYHNFSHTAEVVKRTKEISKKAELSDNEMEIVQLAAWFHDAGYTEAYKGHENASARLAEEFLKNNGYSNEKIDKVKKAIYATEFPSNPANTLEEVICDADMAHLGSDDYPEKTQLLRMEWENILDKRLSDEDWLKTEVDFIKKHKFYTKYAKKEWEGNKLLYLAKLQKRYNKKLDETNDLKKKEEKFKLEKEKLAVKKEEGYKPSRGIETMFRNTIRTHVEFSSMADNKANFIITINTLLIGILFSGTVKEILDNPYFVYPMTMLLAVNIISIVLGILVVYPNITEGKFTKDDILKKKTNLLFFGNFHSMPYDEFHWGMNEMMNDKSYLYDSMIKDFFHLGLVLGKKYRYLSYCYKIFLIGMITSVLAFMIAIIIAKLSGQGLYIPIK